jgi:ribonuclease P protein component
LKILTIKNSSDFQVINKQGQKFFSQTLILLTKKTPQELIDKKPLNLCRFGYTVAKTVSKLAVERNLAKRKLREAVKFLAVKHAKNNFDYVVIARKEILNSELRKIINDLKFCITRIHQAKNPEKNQAKNEKKPK